MHTVAIGCDPNAADAKMILIDFLAKRGYSITDFGSNDPIYANVAIHLAEAVANKQYDRGILICGTGIGVSLAANKVKGAYAALITDAYSAERARKSNNANIACFGAFTIGPRLMETLADIFLSSEFDSNSPSQAKITRICDYENK